MGDPTRGIYKKFRVERTDGKSAIGEKHYGCRYFVLDLDHDEFAGHATVAYANACAEKYPLLSQDLLWNVPVMKINPVPEEKPDPAEAERQNARAIEAEEQINALTAERDALAEQAASVCADAEAVGYYGDRADSAGECFGEAYVAVAAERDQLRAALEAVEWISVWISVPFCPRCRQPKTDGHAPDCIVGLALKGRE